MTIKSSKQYTEMIVALFGCIVAFSSILVFTDADTRFVVIAAIFLSILVVRYWIAACRTLIMNEDGCTVQFLWYRRHYKWSELETKDIEDYTNSFGYLEPYKGGAIFSRKKSKKPAWLMPFDYSFLFHPLCFFFVYFDPRIHFNKWDYRCPDLYVVDEATFRVNMSKWNVEIRE